MLGTEDRRGAVGGRTAVHALLVPAVSQKATSANRGPRQLVKQHSHPTTRPAAILTVIVPQVAARVFRRTGRTVVIGRLKKSAENESKERNG